MEQVFHLVYQSHIKKNLDENDIQSIVDVSKTNNKKNDITGLLILRDNTFVQALEGNEKKVMELYHKIKEDKRHSKVKILLNVKSDERIYKDWSMAYVDARNLKISAKSILDLISMVAENNKYEKSLILMLLEKILNH